MKRMLRATWLYIMLIAFGLVSCHSEQASSETPKIDEIQKRGTLLVGSTGDYRPLSYLEPESNTYWGYDVELTEIILKSRLGQFIIYLSCNG